MATEAEFLRLQADMARVGNIKTFTNVLVTVPAGIDVADYAAVIVWCESYGQFMRAARYGHQRPGPAIVSTTHIGPGRMARPFALTARRTG